MGQLVIGTARQQSDVDVRHQHEEHRARPRNPDFAAAFPNHVYGEQGVVRGAGKKRGVSKSEAGRQMGVQLLHEYRMRCCEPRKHCRETNEKVKETQRQKMIRQHSRKTG